MAICVIAVVGVAPCQCFSLGGNQTTSPDRISSIGPPSRCAQPRPEVTINVWPSGCVCHAVRAPGSNVTLAQRTRAGSGASNSGSMRTLPVNHSAGPFVEACDPDLLTPIFSLNSQLTTINFCAGCEPLLLISISRIHLCWFARLPKQRSQRSTPTVAAENSVRVLPWHSIRLASGSRSKPHPHHHPFSEHPQLIPAPVVEHSAIEQTQGAIRAPVKVDHSQSDKYRDCRALMLQWWQSPRPQCVTTTKRLRHSRRSGTVAVAPVGQHRHRR